MTAKEKVLDLHEKKYNCAQSVFGAFCEDFGVDRETAFKMAGAFGNGMRCGEVCGAASGALMALGMMYGHHVDFDLEQKELCYRKTKEWMRRFNERFGETRCFALLGMDMSDDDVYYSEEALALRNKICPGIMAGAVELMEEAIAEFKNKDNA